jgi:hypothetical protein
VTTRLGGDLVKEDRKDFPALIWNSFSMTLGFIEPCSFNKPSGTRSPRWLSSWLAFHLRIPVSSNRCSGNSTLMMTYWGLLWPWTRLLVRTSTRSVR